VTVTLSSTDVRPILQALEPGADAALRARIRAELAEAEEIGPPDDIEIFRIIRDAGARKRIDVARAICAQLFGR